MERRKVKVPSSKSQTMRALLFATLARGTSQLENLLPSPDVDKMIEACRALGATITLNGDQATVIGRGISPQDRFIDAGNSGQVIRFVAAVSALSPAITTLDGDESIRHRRPLAPLIKGLRDLGAAVEGHRAPFSLRGPIKGRTASIEGSDSQPVSALLIAGAFSPYGLDLHVENPGETPWVKLTLSWLDRLDIPYTRDEFTHFILPGQSVIDGFSYRVPTDFSSLAAPVTHALISQQEIMIEDIEDDPDQGDRKFLEIVEEMGGRCVWGDKSLHVIPSKLKGISIDLNPVIDMAPLLAVLGCFAEGKTRLYNGKIARLKESDRLRAMAEELSKMGGKVEEFDDGLEITPHPLSSVSVNSHNDHRIAMALAIATGGQNSIKEDPCILKSYPGFSRLF